MELPMHFRLHSIILILCLTACAHKAQTGKNEEVAVEEQTKVTTMDSFLIEHEGKRYIYITHLQVPIKVTNPKLPVSVFEIQNDTLIPAKKLPELSGYHIRNIFQMKPNDGFIYCVDHGLDVVPFPGGRSLKIDLKSKTMTPYPEMDEKFNFAGAAVTYKGKKYEIFVGFNYVNLYIDGKLDERINPILEQMGEKQGFLSATFFEHNHQLHVFLGISDIYPADFPQMDRQDFVLELSTPEITFRRVERPVPWNWATVYSEIDQGVAGYGQVLKVAYHNPGFNVPRIGFFEIDSEMKYNEIPLENISQINNNWVPQYLIKKTPEGKLEFLVPLRGGSGGGEFGLLRLEKDKAWVVKHENSCFIGIHEIENTTYGVTCDLKLVKI